MSVKLLCESAEFDRGVEEIVCLVIVLNAESEGVFEMVMEIVKVLVRCDFPK